MLKKYFLLLLLSSNYLFSQGTWTQKANFGGATRNLAVGFSIGTKGYIGTGNGTNPYDDFWEYNPGNDTWTQKANFTPGWRTEAVGFSIGTKGYIGTGQTSSGLTNDFWEYNSSNNTWTQKASFGGIVRRYAASFVVGTKGYIGLGSDFSTTYYNDFWEYDPSNDSWVQKASFPGVARIRVSGFSINGKGYIVSGIADVNLSSATTECWSFDPTNNTWTQKNNFAGAGRTSGVAFVIGTKGYYGTGAEQTNGCLNDFWEYDPIGDSWWQKANFGGAKRDHAVGFAIGGKGYIGTGYTQPANIVSNDFWEFDSLTIGISESEFQNYFSIYPNPSNGIFQIKSTASNYSVEIYDTQGNIICNSNSPESQIKLLEQADGIYFAKITSGNRSTTKKIVISR